MKPFSHKRKKREPQKYIIINYNVSIEEWTLHIDCGRFVNVMLRNPYFLSAPNYTYNKDKDNICWKFHV